MRTLTLLRHAKSSWEDAKLKDFARPLSERGHEGMQRIGSYVKQEAIQPGLVLCSSAARTRETLALLLAHLDPKPRTRFEKLLYMATPSQLLSRIRKIPDTVEHAMIVGHNPGLHALALELIGEGPPVAIIALARKLPTAGLLVIDFPVETWPDVAPISGTLRQFMTPKLLAQ